MSFLTLAPKSPRAPDPIGNTYWVVLGVIALHSYAIHVLHWKRDHKLSVLANAIGPLMIGLFFVADAQYRVFGLLVLPYAVGGATQRIARSKRVRGPFGRFRIWLVDRITELVSSLWGMAVSTGLFFGTLAAIQSARSFASTALAFVSMAVAVPVIATMSWHTRRRSEATALARVEGWLRESTMRAVAAAALFPSAICLASGLGASQLRNLALPVIQALVIGVSGGTMAGLFVPMLRLQDRRKQLLNSGPTA